MAGNISISQFKVFVTSAEAQVARHDQVQCGGDGSLVRVSNSAGSKILRFFSVLSNFTIGQVRKNREIRTKLLEAIRNDNNGAIPDELKKTLGECGFDLTRKNDQSYKALSSRAIRRILTEYSQIKANASVLAANAKSNSLTGDDIKGTIKPETASGIVAKLMALPKSVHMTDDQRQKLTALLECMTKAGVSPNKVVRMAYLFTVGLGKVADSIASDYKLPEEPVVPPEPDAKDAPVYPEKPQDPNSGFLSWFSKPSKEKVEQYKEDLQKYKEDVARIDKDPKTIEYKDKVKAHEAGVEAHDNWNKVCRAIKGQSSNKAKQMFEDVFKGINPFLEILQQKAAAPLPAGQAAVSPHDLAERNMFADAILGSVRDVCNAHRKGVFDEIPGKDLKDLDARLGACAAREKPPAANAQPKSASTKPLSFAKIDLGQVTGMIKKTLMSKLPDFVKIGDLTLTPVEGDSKMLKLSLANLNVSKIPSALKLLLGDSLDIADLSVNIAFDVDPKTGGLEVSFSNFTSTSNEKIASVLSGMPKAVMTLLSAKLGPDVFIDNPVSDISRVDYKLGAISELSVEDSAPVRIGFPDRRNMEEGILKINIDPSRFEPIKSLGFDGDTKFGGVRFVGNDLVLQAGGAHDEIDSLIVEAQDPRDDKKKVKVIDKTRLPGQFGVNIDLGGLGERVGFLMRGSGVTFDSFDVTTNPQDGTVSVDIRNFDIKDAVKDMEGLKGKALRLFGNGSFRLKFKPTVEPMTGTVQLKFFQAESLGGPVNWIKKSLVNTYMRTIAQTAIPVNPDITILDPFDQFDPNEPLTINLNASAIRDLSKFGVTGGARVSALTLSPNGLSLGIDVFDEQPGAGRVVESLG